MRFGSVCSGIEAASVAFGPLGWNAAWFAEIEPFPCSLLAHHYPEVPNLGDMSVLPRRIKSGEIEAPDVFCGGTPCQAFSVAGLRNSLDDARGNLSLIFCEIANEIDSVRSVRGEQPCIIFWENVPGVLSTKDNAFGCFLAGLAGEDDPLEAPGGKWSNAGCVFGPERTVAWRILDAQYFGLAQRRRRVFVVASARDGFDPCKVLFEFDGVRRDTAPSRQAGKGFAQGVEFSPSGGGFTDLNPTLDTRAKDGPVRNQLAGAAFVPVPHAQISPALKARDGKGPSSDGDGAILVPMLAHSLRGEGFDASEDGTGRGTPLVPVGVTIHGTDGTATVASYSDLAQCLRARTPGNIDNSSTTVVQQPIPFDTTQLTSKANYSNPKAGDPCHPLAAQAHVPCIAFTAQDNGRDAQELFAPTMRKGGDGGGVQLAVAYQTQGEDHGRMDGGTPQGTNDLPTGDVRGMRRCECGSASQERGLEGSQTGELAAPLSQLPHEGAPVGGEVPSLRETAQGTGLLRNALPATEAAREPGIQATEACMQCGGMRFTEPLEGLLREACATSKQGDARTSATHQERSGIASMAVRRLTPVECERLQGFSDSYTMIPHRGKPAADGPRYKALGNSWAVPNVRWIGQRIDLVASLLAEQREAA